MNKYKRSVIESIDELTRKAKEAGYIEGCEYALGIVEMVMNNEDGSSRAGALALAAENIAAAVKWSNNSAKLDIGCGESPPSWDSDLADEQP